MIYMVIKSPIFTIFQGVGSATPGILVVALVFILPSKLDRTKSSPALLDWPTGNNMDNLSIILSVFHFSVEKKLPWGVILLLGGGFALADVTEKSGLSQLLVDQLDPLKV
mgnify:FL=1